MTLQAKLLAWFRQNARPLPWRRRYDPYEVWVSEIMLQQTQMDTVLPYFERWMKAFPDIRSLARAGEKKVLKHWEGLGYYSRARNLHRAAKRIVKQFGGKFPDDFESIRSLPGVGRYTAGAIASIAYNETRPIVDGNVLRVLSRVYAIKTSIDEPKNREEFWALEERLIPEGQARDFNQALMELGALVCAARNPLCPKCPLERDCRALRAGEPEKFPVRRPRQKTIRVTAAAVAVQKNGHYLLRRRPEGQIMGGLWEFPEWKLARDSELTLKEITRRALRSSQKELGVQLNELKHLGRIKRNYTHHLETLEVFNGKIDQTAKSNGWKTAWTRPRDFSHYPFSSAHAKIAKLVIQ